MLLYRGLRCLNNGLHTLSNPRNYPVGKWFDVTCVLIVAAAIFAPYGLGGMTDYEDLNSTVLTTKLFVEALADAKSPFWTPLLGLGLPQPFRINHAQHPLAVLYLMLDPLTVVRIFVAVHLIIGGVGSLWLARSFGLTRAASLLCAFTFLTCATTAQYLYRDDWPSNLLTWSLLPWLLGVTAALLRSDGLKALGLSVTLGLLAGFQIATGLFSYVLTHLIIVLILVVVEWRASLIRWHFLLLAAVITLAAGAGVLTLLVSEWQLFPANTLRVVHPQPDLREQVWSMFLHPFWITGLTRPPGPFAEGGRTIGFGVVFCALAILGLMRPQNNQSRKLAAGFILSCFCLVLPPSAFLNATTALWLFRDGVIMFGILLAATVLQALPRRWTKPLLFLQCMALTLSILPDWFRTFKRAEDVSAGKIVGQSALTQKGALDDQLTISLARVPGRLLIAPELYAKRSSVRELGIADNAFAFRAIPVLNTFARGIATSPLYPERGLMEGFISSESLGVGATLDVLGVRFILALAGEKTDPRLVERSSVVARDGTRVRLLENPHAWPPAVFVSPAIAQSSLPLRKDCPHNRFLCRDFKQVSAWRRPGEITVIHRYGNTTLTFKPEREIRTILLSDWHRKGWIVNTPGVTIYPLFGQLTGLVVPPGMASVRMHYAPTALLISYVLSTAVIVFGTVSLIAVWVKRRIMQ